jgi:hypothetical protein
MADAAMAGLLAAAAATPPVAVIDWQPLDDTVRSLTVGQRGLGADLITEGSPLDAHATHSLGISPGVSDRLYVTLGLGQSSGVDYDAARVAAWAIALQHPWLVDILNSVKTFPAVYPTFRLLLD